MKNRICAECWGNRAGVMMVMGAIWLAAFRLQGQAAEQESATKPLAEAVEGPGATNQTTVEIKSADGSRLQGECLQKTLRFQSATLGTVQLPITQIRTMQLTSSNFAIETVTGDRLLGRLLEERLGLKTCLGEVNIPAGLLLSLAVTLPGAVDLNNGLVARWSAEGNAKDSVGHHDGELMFGAKFAEGVRGQAFSFDGTRSKVSIPDDPAFKPTNSFTIEGWLALPARSPNGDPVILFNRGDNRGGLDSYQIAVQADGRLSFTIWDGANQMEMLCSPVPKDRWVHVAAVYHKDTSTMEWYVNAERTAKVETKVQPILELDPANDPAVGIGNHGGRMHQWPSQSLIDEWGYYSRALSRDEIRARYRAGNPDKPRPRVRWSSAKGLQEL